MKSHLKMIFINYRLRLSLRKFLILTLILTFSISTASFAANQTEFSEGPSIGLDETARKIASLFPKVQGEILSTEESTVKINLGIRDGISPQMRLTILREGKEFFHPVTKVVMGRFETILGLIEIKDVMEGTSTGIILEKKEEITKGDKVRITHGKIRIALIFSDGLDRDAAGAFSDALEGTDRFRVLEEETVKKAMEKEGLQKIGPESKGEIKILGRSLDTEGIVFLEIKPASKGLLIRADLVHSFDGKHFGTYESPILTSQKRDMDFPFPERKDYWKAFDFNYRARLLGMGDLDGDGREEIVISDGTRIRVYRVEGSDLLEVWADKYRRGDNHIAIDVADINKNGRAEVFITNHGESLDSFVIEYRDGEYRRVWNNVPLFFRVIHIPGKGETLIAQGLDGNIHEYSSKDGGYIKEKPLKLPLKVEIYGFAFVDWDGMLDYQILSIDDDDYLNLYNPDGVGIWRSKEHYGGSLLSYEKPHWIIEGKLEKKWVNGRIIIKDYGDGKQRAIVIRNIPITYIFRELRGYREAEVIGLRWNGMEIVEDWRIGKLNGFIADYGIGNLSNDGKENLCLIMNPTLMAGKSILLPGLKDVISGKSSLLIYNLSRR